MTVRLEFRVLELLCARLCHELVSPVGAINNGLELLDEDDPDFVKEAVNLIGQSARKAGQRLQFYRFAYGSSGGAISGPAPNAGELAEGLLEGGKLRCEWAAEVRALSNEWQKLACNLLVLVAEALPRGGAVAVRGAPAAHGGIEVTGEGEGAGLSAELRAALEAEVPVETLSSRTVQAYMTARLAEHIGARLAIAAPHAGKVVITAARE